MSNFRDLSQPDDRKERERQIAEVEEEIDLLCKVWPAYYPSDSATMERIVDVEKARLAELKRGLREQLRVRSQPVSDEEWMDATGTTAVFENELMTREAADDLIAARSAAPEKEGEDAGGSNV